MSKWVKRGLSVLLSVVLIGSAVPLVSVPAVAAAGYGSNGKFLAEISPPAADSTTISTRAQLEAIKNNLSGKYHLTADIDLSGSEWVPIGSSSASFRGIFDGQGHVIKNLTITQGTGRGLFDDTYYATIKNVGMEGTHIDAGGNVAASICGSGYSTKVDNCYNTGNISASVHAYGIAYSGTFVNNCFNTGNIASGTRAGGIGSDAITNCYNTGNITVSTASQIAIAGGISANGGLYAISNCYNTGNIFASSTFIPSLGTLGDRYAIAGGICGQGWPELNNCYNTGDVSASTISIPAYAGGIHGMLISGSGSIDNCYNTGTITATSTNAYMGIGGILGEYRIGTLSSNYCLSTYGSVYGTLLSSSEMKNKENFAGWDFDTIWDIENGGYPFLRNLQGGGDDNPYNDELEDLFADDAYTYNHKLATIAAELSDAAYDKADMHGALNRYGFNMSDPDVALNMVRTYNYDNEGRDNPDYPDIVGYTLATRKIIVNNELKNIVIIAIRGTPETDEWFSNFKINSSPDEAIERFEPYGFTEAKDNLYASLDDYFQRLKMLGLDLWDNVDENILFITGHSRGAAVANLLAAQLDREATFFKPQSIYAYTFATPNTTKRYDRESDLYKNIYNFVNPEDFVPYLPLSLPGTGWDFWKYGNTYALPIKNSTIKNIAEEKYKEITGEEAQSLSYVVLADIVLSMYKLANNTYDYYHKEHTISGSSYRRTTYEFFTVVCNAKLGASWAKAELAAWCSPYSSYKKLAALFAETAFSGRLVSTHAATLYLAWMKVTNGINDFNSYFSVFASNKRVRIACPVDVEIYDSAGNLAGKVINNFVDETINSDVAIVVDDDIKYLYLPASDSYTLKLVGTDTGTMNYTVETIDMLSATTTQQKEFKNVALTAGKIMTSTVGDTIANLDVQLLVSDSTGKPIATINTNGTETPITQTDPKQYFKLWGKVTRWEKTFWNWVLLIVCFGWIWMWF